MKFCFLPRSSRISLLILLLLVAASPKRTNAKSAMEAKAAAASLLSDTAKIVIRTAKRQPKTAIVLTAGGSFVLYSYMVQKYAEHVVKKMQAVPSPETLQSDSDIQLPEELRTTVSKATNLVINPWDRLRWNRWIVATDTTSNEKLDEKTLRSLVLHSGNEPGIFRFRYRTHANFEETGAVHKAFWTWQRFKCSVAEATEMVFSESNDKSIIADVQMQDSVLLFGGLLRIHINWYGKLVKDENHNSSKFTGNVIEWTSTDLKKYLPWNKVDQPYQFIKNPAMSALRAKTPWDAVKAQDGMLCLRMGDVGYMVFDSE